MRNEGNRYRCDVMPIQHRRKTWRGYSCNRQRKYEAFVEYAEYNNINKQLFKARGSRLAREKTNGGKFGERRQGCGEKTVTAFSTNHSTIKALPAMSLNSDPGSLDHMSVGPKTTPRLRAVIRF